MPPSTATCRRATCARRPRRIRMSWPGYSAPMPERSRSSAGRESWFRCQRSSVHPTCSKATYRLSIRQRPTLATARRSSPSCRTTRSATSVRPWHRARPAATHPGVKVERGATQGRQDIEPRRY
jgi:hypothetical protein